SDPPKKSANNCNRKSIIPPSTAYHRKILSLGELEKNPPTCSYLPKLPPYKFFCRHCQEYFPSDQSLTDHIKTNHNILLNISDQKFHSQIIPVLDSFSATTSNTFTKSTLVNKSQNIVVPQVEDHTDLVSPIKAFLENLYIPDPENLQNNPIKKGCLLPNITKTISNNSSSDSSPSADDIKVSAEIHNKPLSQPSPPRQCNLCDFVARKKAGLRLHFYKEHRFQIIPPPAHLVDDSDKIDVLPSQEDPPPVIGILNKSKKVSFNILADTPTFTTTPSDSPLPPDVLPPAHGFSDVDIDFQTPPPRRQTHIDPKIPVPPAKFVAFENSVLKFSFPLQKKLSCPVPNCSASFGTKLWYLTNSSIKKHLNVFHKSKPSKVEYFCTICNSTIKKLPSKHNCLINNLILPSDPVDDEVWVCDLCPDFSATSATAKRNHLASHNRQKILEDKTPLIVPPSASKTKKNRKKRIQVLSDGHPGDTPLARPQRNSNDPPPAEEEEHLPLQEKLDLEHPSLLVSFVEPLDALLDVDEIDNVLPTFENIVSDIVSVIQEHFHLSRPSASIQSKNKTSSKAFDPQDAQRVQKLYHWNRKRCIRNIQNPVSSRCSISKSNLVSHFSNVRSPPVVPIDFPSVTPPDLPPVVDFLSPEMVFSCLQGCENSAPGPDLISYKHWREIDPRGIVLSKIFNICIKIKKILPAWKQSSCVLIPKKGDPSIIESWRPISLSSTIYKLFTKCLTRRLQDWCETHGVISNCQKGFTPFDGVVEHNFVIGQHMEFARRSHSDCFFVWLDISNAFGSIPHDVLFTALSNHGIDLDFIDIVRDIYLHSFTQILSNEGPTEPIPLLCGVKQVLQPAVIEGDHWVCDICECFSATTQVAKKNHLDAHAREVIKANSSQLIIPPASKTKKKLLNKRIKDLSEGPAGNLPLAPPIADAIDIENPPGEEIENFTKIDIEKVSILSSFAEPLDAILEVDDLEGAQVTFENLLNDMISIIQNHFHLAPLTDSKKVPSSNSSNQVKTDSQNAQLIQRQYRWNRRKCVRNIVNPTSSFCQIEKEILHSHFTKTWAPPSSQYSYPDCSPPTLPPVLELLPPDSIAACLQSCENSAPGPDRLSYQHWKTIDPSCIIIAKIFNICIKLKDIPSSWKNSNCILIPKKGDLSSINNWRSITLSNSIYKLFSKCLARKLQDWCGNHDILSSCQKGFTPFDGVVEHNFVIGQHLEAARRSHNESFLVWLDISNAFGSIPHNILFSAMSSVGIDKDFIHLIQKLYSNSSTSFSLSPFLWLCLHSDFALSHPSACPLSLLRTRSGWILLFSSFSSSFSLTKAPAKFLLLGLSAISSSSWNLLPWLLNTKIELDFVPLAG
ncbi:retrovirus-related Pol polyprotein from type-2 retrotransposable element R2DM, partial [Nephila pilipes]